MSAFPTSFTPSAVQTAWSRLAPSEQLLLGEMPVDLIDALCALVDHLTDAHSIDAGFSHSRDAVVPPDHPQLDDLVTALDLLDHPATDSTGNHLAAAAEAIDVAISQLPDLPCVEFERHDLDSIMKSLLGKAGA